MLQIYFGISWGLVFQRCFSDFISIVSFNQGFNDIPFEVNFVEYNNIYENSVKFTCNFEVWIKAVSA